jgi:diguanylate cyclase (GGDEF)-like protein
MRAAAVVPGSSLLAHEAGVILIDGALLSLFAGVLVWVLGAGRARARRLVAQRTAELRHQALHDALTGLPNRALILDRLERLCARSRRSGAPASVLFVDLDDFKAINDTLGHDAGDQLLRAVAERLRAGLRDADTVGRLGGDEFVVMLDCDSPLDAQQVSQRMIALLREPFALDEAIAPLVVTASIGGAVGFAQTPSDLLRDADIALYQAKAEGKNRCEIFQPALETAVRHRLELQRDLRGALANGQLRLLYQPVYRCDDLSLLAVEALLRWEHPTFGLIPPGQFIPLLETDDRIRETGRWVLEQACGQAARWHEGGTPIHVSVNVSGRQLDDEGIVEDVREALESSGLPPSALTIEITETALMRDPHATAARVRAIKALGVGLAIDDFGTGYSSLASLQRLTVDAIKIDRAFTSAIGRSAESDALIHILVQLGRAFGLHVLAEGVESLEQLDRLRAEGVDYVQGFLLSRPLETGAAPGRPVGACTNRRGGACASPSRDQAARIARRLCRSERDVASTALGSYPQCAMQLSQRGSLPRPYFDQSVCSISSLYVFTYPSDIR